MKFTFVAPCLFGLEGIAGDELRRMDMENVRVEDRRVLFEGDEAALAKANINIRMIDQGSSELNIIIGVSNSDYEKCIDAIYKAFIN